MTALPLKTYQQSALAALALFLRQAGTMGLEAAWAHAMAREGSKAGLPYRAEELGDVPCVCLRIPTGGGKTLMASHAIPLIAQAWTHRAFPVALWLVPSDTIRSQTLAALQNSGHAYRAALQDAYGERFQVCELDALREEWDCSFAYVLCSLQNLRSNQAVEQLLGRVLRMPYAKKRKSPALNKAYVHVIARSFSEAANSLVDSLTRGMGFDAMSAASVLLPDDGDLFGALPGDASAHGSLDKTLTLELALHGLDAETVRTALQTQPDVELVPATGAGEPIRLRVKGPVSDVTRNAILSIANNADKTGAIAQFDQHNARLNALRSAAERDVPFAPIPQPCVRVQGELELIERETLGELIEFDLLRADPRPELLGFNLVQQSDMFEIYVEGERVSLKQADAAQLSLDTVPNDANQHDLVIVLEHQVRRAGLTQTTGQRFAMVEKNLERLEHGKPNPRGCPVVIV